MKKVLYFLILLLLVGGVVELWEVLHQNQGVRVGGDRDEHGCLPSAGYSWCPSTNKCQRMWEEYCEEFKQNYTGVNKDDLITLVSPYAGQEVKSPLTVSGKARGSWFFEASFPVMIVDWDGKIIGQGVAQAKGDWMTEDYVDFTATINFKADTSVSNKGAIILKKDNPSGLPANDNALEVPILFAK